MIGFIFTALVFLLGAAIGLAFLLGLIFLVLLAMGNDQIDRARDEISEK